MGNELDFIDNPLSCLEKNDPILALNVAELTEDKCTKLKIINYFIENLSDEKNNPYLIGYSLYMKSEYFNGDEKKKILEDAIGYFLKSTSDKKNKIYAQAYLLYSYYDLERYDDALNIIKNIPRDYFSKKKQRWRDLLTSQLEICCLIKLGRLNDLENIIYDYFVSLTKAKDTDVLMPIELVETLRSIRQVNSAKEH